MKLGRLVAATPTVLLGQLVFVLQITLAVCTFTDLEWNRQMQSQLPRRFHRFASIQRVVKSAQSNIQWTKSAFVDVAVVGTNPNRVPTSCWNRLYHCPRISFIKQQQQLPTTTIRLFGSKVGSTIPGIITVENDQDAVPNIDLDKLQQTANKIRHFLGYETYDMSITLVDDKTMQQENLESRNVDAPTDILSFPFHECIEPGKLEDPPFDVPDYYNIGDIVIDVPYVLRVCQLDQQSNGDEDLAEDEVYDDRGVAPTMATVFDPEKRLHMLLVHGMLHLVGYDHETDPDYEIMVTKEDEFLKRLGLKD